MAGTTSAVPEPMCVGLSTGLERQRPSIFFPGTMSILPVSGCKAEAPLALATLVLAVTAADWARMV